MANATLMCRAFGREVKDWHKLDSTQRYINAIVRKNHFVDNQIVTTRKGGTPGQTVQGTWIHERLIIKLAQWLDVDFEIWCDERMAELLRTGKVEL